jgi:hypothetical protein
MTTQVRKNVMDMFIDGARRGFTIATTNLLPNVVMAFVIIQALKITGLLDWVGHICEPVMALWGLPGEAATVLLAALMSMGGRQSGNRWRINRSRCHRFTARDVFNGQPGAKCRSLPGDSRSECQILPAYHYGLRD